MDSTASESNEPSVDEGAFWHTNMDLYYGYLKGEVVEVEHESHKYWLATIQYCYKHLLLLKWVGNYDEFWIDTSINNTTTNSCGPSNELNVPKRVFPLGYHLQSQLKSQFTLEKPSKILIKPSLYNPSKDPYAEIRTVDDLLAYEIDYQNNDDAFVDKSTSETAGHVLAKCKTKINYRQEDVDELEAALQNLNDMDYNESKGPTDSPDNQMSIFGNTEKQGDSTNSIKNEKDSSDDLVNACKDSGVDSDISNQRPSSSPDRRMNEILKDEDIPKSEQVKAECGEDPKHDQICLDLCKQLQASAINKGRYMGIHSAGNEQTDDVYFLKPKQFFDVGGANHERLFVPGTILEISYTKENSEGYLDIFHWFAFIVKNIGGRLTLRWFICDEPKFKQGRLEMKSCRSKFVTEDVEPTADNNNGNNNPEDSIKIVDDVASLGASKHIPVKSITFTMHFCDPKIHKIGHGKSVGREYKLPDKILNYVEETHGQEYATRFAESQLSHIHDTRRMYLDKDRPLIDHILTVVRNRAPNYLDLVFAPKDKNSRREVLISCPKMTKLLRASIKRELEPGIFEVHSEPLQEDGEIIKFIYPYNNSYSILPLDWAINNKDCLSISPSRNPSPVNSDQSENNLADNDGESKGETIESDTKDTITTTTTANIVTPITVKVEADEKSQDEPSQQKPESTESKRDHVVVEHCLKASRSSFPKAGGPFTKMSEAVKADIPELQSIPDFDEFNPSCWSEVLRTKEMNAPLFHCCIDYSLKEEVESRFKVMDQLEIVHPSSDSIICSGRIRKVVFPLLWIQLSSDCYTLVPFNLTDMYPARWCETYNHQIISLLPPRKRCHDTTSASQSDTKQRKKAKIPEQNDKKDANRKLVSSDFNQLYEKEHFDLGALNDRQSGIDYILNEKSAYVKIYFNHKCFTGPSLSKSKICSLPQYVGPGPMRLVLEEVVTKVISVAYVPPRILNDLSSKSFEELLIERNLTNTSPMEFKAKYQKRVHRESIPVCLNPDDVAFYCECICEHIKCCYNLFGPNLYDGDDCPSHCRSLTKSNKFMKRATYYREKARQGEYLSNVNNVCSKFTNPEDWSVEDVAQYLDWCQLSIFKTNMKSEGIDGRALLLLDNAAIKEHFQRQTKSDFTPEEVDKLCRFVELVRTRAEANSGI